MIILDTNVVSEPLKPFADPPVEAWLNRQTAETLYMTTTSMAELLFGIERLPHGRRKRAMASAMNALFERLFSERLLSFDKAAAIAYASLVSKAQVKGYAISVADGQIAAIAEVHGFKVATRDSVPFKAAGIPIINPWNE